MSDISTIFIGLPSVSDLRNKHLTGEKYYHGIICIFQQKAPAIKLFSGVYD